MIVLIFLNKIELKSCKLFWFEEEGLLSSLDFQFQAVLQYFWEKGNFSLDVDSIKQEPYSLASHFRLI